MDQRAVAGEGPYPRYVVLILLLAWLLSGCASGPSSSPQRLDSINGQWITVQRGDTLGAIASRADVPLERLTRFNPGVEPHRLAVGQRLLIPTQQERAPSGGPYRYQVRPGDTYSGIARRFGTDTARVQSANASIPANRLQVGQIIQVPLGGSTSSAARSSTASTASSGGSSSSSRPPAQRPDPGNLPSSARNWPWPLDDYRVVRHFGPDQRGTLQPMLLATQNGSQAKAVADGQVRFAGSMRQLGRVVIVHHDGNLQSVYALCGELKVADGQSVSRGTPLCQVDYSNSTERYDLLFDLRHGGKPVDPAKVLR